MRKRYRIISLYAVVLLLILLTGTSCDTGVEASLDPGIVRVNLVGDQADTSLVIVNDIYTIADGDSMAVKIFQGKVFKDSVFAVLYRDIKAYQQEDITYNIIKRENNKYKSYTIFESYVPPFEYDRIQFGITSSIVKLSGFDDIKVESSDDDNIFVDLYEKFEVFENSVTEINICLEPFQSITRYRDSYKFVPVIRISSIVYE